MFASLDDDLMWSSSADELRTPMPGHQASQPVRRAATVLPLVVSLAVGLFGCAEPNRILVSGNVDDDVLTVQAPQIEIPEPDLNDSFASALPATPGLPATSGQAIAPLGSWNRLATVEVREGDQVQAGQVLVRFESEALRANINLAHADARVAASQVPVIDSAIDKTYDKERDINSALKKINKAVRQLKTTRANLARQLSQARRQLPQLEAKRDQVQSQREQLHRKLRQVNQQRAELKTVLAQLTSQPRTSAPSPAPGSPNREQIIAAIAKLQEARTQLQSGLKQLTRAEGQLTTGLARLRSGIPKLENAI